MTTFWHRRICEAVILAAGIILALYAWALMTGVRANGTQLLISGTSAAFAVLTIIAAGGSYFFGH